MATDNIRIYTKPQYDGTISEFAKSEQIAPYWDAASSYSAGDNAVLSGVLYISLVSSNVGNNPSSSPSKWFACNVFTPGYRRLCEDIVGQLPWSQQRHYSVNPNLHSNIAVKDGVVYACTENIVEGSAFNPSKWSSQYYPTTGGWLTATLRTSGTVSLCGQPLNLDTGNSMIGASSTGFAFATIEKVGNSFVNVSSFLDCSNNDLVSTELNSLVLSAPSWTKTSYGAGKFVKRNGALSVSKQQLTDAQSEAATSWNAIDGAVSMFSSSNTSLIRDALPSSEGYERIVTVGSVDVFIPSDVCSVVVSLVNEISTETVVGETVLVYNGSAPSGTPFASVAYNGKPVSIALKIGNTYCISLLDSSHQLHFDNVVITPSTNTFVTMRFGRVGSFSDICRLLPTFATTSAANDYLCKTVIQDTWTAEGGSRYSDPMVCTAVKDYIGEDNLPHRGAKMERKYATLHSIEFCTGRMWEDAGTTISSPSYGVRSISCSGNILVAVDNHGETFFKSTTSNSWSDFGSGTFGGGRYSVCHNDDGRWVSVGRHYAWVKNGVYDSSGWSNFGPFDGDGTMLSVCYGRGTWVAVGTGGQTYERENFGSTSVRWDSFGSCPTTMRSVCYANGQWVAVGDNGYVCAKSSLTFDAWTIIGQLSGNLKCVIYANGRLVVASSDGNVYTMADGESSWTSFGSCADGLISICYAGGKWVAVTEGGLSFVKSGISSNWVPFGAVTEGFWDVCADDNGVFHAISYYGHYSYRRSGFIPTGSSLSNYKDSTIRQYLNSTGTCGRWHSKKHGSSQPNPSNYDLIYGYRLGCSSALTSVAHAVRIPCQAPYSDSASSYEVCDVFFIDSATERYGETVSYEGTYDQYWKDATGLENPTLQANAGRVQYCVDSKLTAAKIHLRSSSRTQSQLDGEKSRQCIKNGSIDSTYTNELNRVSPCCVIW